MCVFARYENHYALRSFIPHMARINGLLAGKFD